MLIKSGMLKPFSLLDLIRNGAKLLGLILSFVMALYAPGFSAYAAYKSGHEVLADNLALANKENGFYVTVPVDYSDPLKGNTEVYAYFRNGYDSNLPTLAVFTGGPGQSAHFLAGSKFDKLKALGYNILIFDQRGIAFSRPPSESLWHSSDFYSSENTAKDLEEIRKKLNIKKWSIYGGSYGTVPATIYGHLFKSVTQSLILEGTVYDGLTETPQKDDFMLNLVQHFFDSLKKSVKEKLKTLVEKQIISNKWFSQEMQQYLVHSGEKNLWAFADTLERASQFSDEQFVWQYKTLKDWSGPKEPSLVLFEDKVNSILTLKEFSLAEAGAFAGLALEGEKIKKLKVGNNSIANSEESRPQTNYLAAHYPLSVPTYYINGSRDGATMPPWALKHYKNVPQKEAYLLLLKRGGHMPSGEVLNSEASPQAEAFLKILLKKMMRAAPISPDDVSYFNSLGEYKFAFVSRGEGLGACHLSFK